MKIVSYILLVLAALVFILAGVKSGVRLTALSPNSLIKLAGVLLLGCIATSLIACGNKGK